MRPWRMNWRRTMQTERGHIVLQMENHIGQHQAGGPLHYAFTADSSTSQYKGWNRRQSKRNSANIGHCSQAA